MNGRLRFLSVVAAIVFFLVCPHTILAVRDGGYDITSSLWAKAILQVSGSPVTLVWKEIGTDITPSGDQVISGYFYANPNDFSYGSQYNPEVFAKIYIAKSGWCNIAFNHVTVDNVSISSAHNYAGAANQSGTATLSGRLVEHQYNGVGQITYTYNGQAYRIQALEGSAPENISLALDSLSPLPPGTKDNGLNISPDGKWMVLQTERFDPECVGWACMAVVPSDLSSGDAIRVNGEVLHGAPIIASGGNLVIYSHGGGTHQRDLWAVRRSSTNGNWESPVELTTVSPYTINEQPAISSNGDRVVFECTNESYSGAGYICEVGTDGQGFRVLVTPSDSPAGLPDEADLHHPDYAPDGSIVFEADWSGEQLWRLPVNATAPVRITDIFNNDNSPCVLSDGRIVSLWLNRPGGQGFHEIKVMPPDAGNYYVLLPDIDVYDIGLGCGD